MVIKITRKVPAEPVAEVAPGGLVPTDKPNLTEREKSWNDYLPPVNAERKVCAYCDKAYLKPCIEENHKDCANYQAKVIREAGKKS